MSYHILKRITDQDGTYYISVPVNVVYPTPEAVQDAAREHAAKHPDDTLYLVQEFAKVAVEPVVTLTSTIAPPPGPVYRDAASDQPGYRLRTPEPEAEGPKMDVVRPSARPRLLVSAVKPSKEDYMRYLMVVAEGRIVKNAFGALELDDMPLTPEERTEVMHALGKS